MSRPVLKVGTTFSDTATSSPLRGFRPVRASRFFTANTPKQRNSTLITTYERGRDRVQDGVYDGFSTPLVQVQILLGNLFNHTESGC